MSQSHRVRFREGGGAEESVVVKLASEDPTSRATGFGMGAYYREVAFYRELAGRIGGPLARCHLAVYDEGEGWFTLVLEDVRERRPGRPDRGLRRRRRPSSRCARWRACRRR